MGFQKIINEVFLRKTIGDRKEDKEVILCGINRAKDKVIDGKTTNKVTNSKCGIIL